MIIATFAANYASLARSFLTLNPKCRSPLMTTNLITSPFNTWIFNGFFALIISMLLTGILIPRILLISYRKKLFDVPDKRKIHHGTVPRLGGMAFMPSILLALTIVAGVNILMAIEPQVAVSRFCPSDILELCFGFSALMMMYLIGLADDLVGVRYRAKFVAQIIASVLIVSSGMTIDNLEGFIGIYALSPWVADVLTLMVLLLVINAINLIDGIDGLASGLSAIALAFYAFLFFKAGDYLYFMLSMASFGTLVPFFYYNVFGDQKVGKKIFMGDAGALTTGLILSVLAIKTSSLSSIPDIYFNDPLAIGFSPLVVPCLDEIRVFFHRLRAGRSPFEPGHTHIHHKLLALGMKQRSAMLTIITLSAFITLLNIMLVKYLSVFMVLAIDIVGWTAFNIILTRKIQHRKKTNPEIVEIYD